MARKTKEDAEQTRLAILDSALQTFYEKGFSRTNGSGLGLYTCKWVAERLGAEFALSNSGRSGKGAEFTMRFSK